MVTIKFSQFFDRKKVIEATDKAERATLSKAGAFVRQRAKTSIRKSKKSASPGQAPRSHVGTLRSLILFGYDSATKSVVIGPSLSKGSKPTVPELLEFGGVTRHWRTGQPVTYRAFPYMAPALAAEAPKFPELFANSVR